MVDNLEIIRDYSNLIIRSPSCSCVLNDILEMIIENWQLELATILINNRGNEFSVLTCSTKNPELMDCGKFLPNEILKNALTGQVYLKTCSFREKRCYLTDSGEFKLILIPLWLESTIIGVVCLITEKEVDIDNKQLMLLQIVINQISHALEKELAKERINSLQNSFNSILNSLTEGIIIINKDNDKVMYTNIVADKLLNMGDLIDKDLDYFLKKIIKISKEPLKTEIYLETALMKTITYSFEIETVHDLSLRITKFLIKSKNHGALNWGFHISNISKQKENDKLKNDLIATVSHELRTPLTSIKGNISALLRDDVQWPENEQDIFLKDINDECDRLNDMIEKLLDISKINAGVLKLDKELLTLEKLLKIMKEKVYNKYLNNVVINIDLEDKQEIIKVDQQRILQVLFNLVDNAIKYGHSDVKVRISVIRKNEMLEFSVIDNGPGIQTHVLKRIFEKFYQGKIDTNSRLGSGLGLAICKGFVEAHGGEIWAESVLGQGSSFYFTLPLDKFLK